MKRRVFRSSKTTGFIIAAVVMITGAFGYVYITRLNSEVASTHTTKQQSSSAKPLSTSSTSPTEIAAPNELDQALDELDAITIDDASSDISSLQQAANEF